jgi:hypothetical protein
MTTMDHTELLQPDGHLTEVALTCAADGELDLLPHEALAHLDGCDHCSRRLGEAALLSVAAGDALRALAPEAALAFAETVVAEPVAPLVAAPVVAAPMTPSRWGEAPHAPRSRWGEAPQTPRTRRPLPVAAIAVALLVSLVTAGPALLDAVRGVPGTLADIINAVPYLVRVGAAFVRAPWGDGAALVFRCASVLVLAAVGIQVARIKSRSTMDSGSFQEGGV